ncbi:MAG: ABC transporter permease [Propionibacteriaceae bacterium]|jgi:peptide/nickel transport system permease protein|nr:ABC transporter permease [Propionibacteriaceae bacterium]
MKRSLLFIIGVVLVAMVALLALVSVFWTPFDPSHVDPAARLLPPGWPHLMGTDHLGLDIFSRILSGARICLLVGVIAVAIGALIGVPLGLISGSGKGWVSHIIMRAADIIYAFPALLLAILLAAANGGGSIVTAMVAIGISSVPAFIRVARAATLQVMSQDFILAARASATPKRTIAFQHVLPNIAPVVLVQSSVSFGLAILAEAALSYLGLSAPPTTVTWGRMLFDAQSYLFTDPNLALWPGLFIALAVLGCNLLGDGLREVLDPRLQEVR